MLKPEQPAAIPSLASTMLFLSAVGKPEGVEHPKYYFALAGLLIVSVLLVCLHVYAKKQNHLLEQQKKEHKQLMEYTSTIEALYENLREQKHDFLNVLFSMHGYVERGQIDELRSYYHSIIDTYGGQLPKQSFSSLNLIQNTGLKGMLCCKLNHAVSIGIDVSLSLLAPISFPNINSLDLCRVIGILLDNAIEAACESSAKELHFGTDVDAISASVIISNSYLNKPDLTQIHNRGYSTKAKNRGIGLYNVRQILAKSESVHLKTTLENNLFIQELILYA